jgi:hypothetical protein
MALNIAAPTAVMRTSLADCQNLNVWSVGPPTTLHQSLCQLVDELLSFSMHTLFAGGSNELTQTAQHR